MVVSGAFATATEMPILAVKKLASDTKKKHTVNKKCFTRLAVNKKTRIKKKRYPQFFFARPSLIKLKNMGAVEMFFVANKKHGCSGSLFCPNL